MKVGEEVRGYQRSGSRRLLLDPAYTPDIAHLVHRGGASQSSRAPPLSAAPSFHQETKASAKSARARLAEVLSLTRTATRIRQVTQRKGSQERGFFSGGGSGGGDSRRSSLHIAPERSAMSPSSRGSNVSVLHLRSVSEPWEAKTSVYATPNYNYPSSNYSRRVAREGSLNVDGKNSRELSPVRWCDKEVDGVFLGRSGWVQVQQPERQKSLSPPQQHVTRIKMANYHCSKSEPGKSVELQRPGYLPLPGVPARRNRASPSSLDLSKEEPITPPPPTPIISPPPAFQDVKHKARRTAPFLSRSNAIEVSPPPSPKFRLSPNQQQRRRLSPSPVYPSAQTRSLEDSSGRRNVFQKHRDSSSSSSSSFGFRSLDTSLIQRPVAMPKLKEAFTDSSMGGYEDGDEESLTMSDYNTILHHSPDMERVSPSGRSRPRTRRSPCQDMKNGSPGSSSSSESEMVRRSGINPRGRSPRTVLAEQEKASRVRRSRSLQLPDRFSPGHYQPQQVLSNCRAARQAGYSRGAQSEERNFEAELRREAEEEARVVTEFLQSVRSREAARNLLRQRFMDRDEEPAREMTPQVVVVRPTARGRILQRGVTAGGRLQQPTNQDFWPPCVHMPKPPNQTNMRLSHSYPNQKAQQAQRDYASTRSSPASLERVNDASPRARRGNSLNVPNHEDLETRRNRYRRSPDRYEETIYRQGHNSEDPIKISPVNSLMSNSSSSNDVWLTASERAMVRAARFRSSLSATTPVDRPGSAPAAELRTRGPSRVENAQRSLSLPKCFQTGRELPRLPQSQHHPPPRIQYNGGPWGGRRLGTTSPSLVSNIRPPTPEIARTAPPTPVRDVVHGDRKSGLLKTTKFSSTPLLDPGSDWDIPRTWSNDEKELKDDDDSGSGRYSDQKDSQRISESVLQKFRKSFSLRFHKKGSGSSKEGDDEDVPPEDSPPETPQPKEPDTSSQEKFRLGPLVWRSSKERKKAKKAARSAKCNSGDSGIQIEMVGGRSGVAGDSSETNDTDHLADDENADDLDSPSVVRRGGTASSSEGRPSRPTSDVINQFLIDRLKAELEARGLRKRGQVGVRRTYSDLGGQRLYNWEMRRGYRRMPSHPLPLRAKPNRENSLSNNSNASGRNWRKPQGRPNQMRRSVSQPLGINELSPLMLRKTTGGRTQVLSEDERGGAGTSDDEMLSDSESSIASLTDRKKSLEQAMEEEVVILAEAVWDHVAMETEELAFRAGDVIEVLDTLDKDWWWGAKGQSTGWFPSAFVRLRVSQEDTVEDCLAAVAAGKGTKTLRRRVSISLLSNDQVRSRVVTELVNTERDFVKILRDVQEGYLTECRRRTDMFSEEQIRVIFSNLDELLEFQEKFLIDLEARVDWEAPHKSCLADIFLQHRDGFRMYSEYCNSHPLAIATLQELYKSNSYEKFFEACRLMRGLMEIPLDGYLLTPVQRICKYPLQLAELLKYTKTDHEDYKKIQDALDAMRGVAVLINERKRRMESLEKLALWQSRVEGWEGEDLIESSSLLIHQGEGVRVKSGMWTSNITLFLFDHQLIYCKKDILKRNTYVYKGRIYMDSCEVVNLSDGKEASTGVTVRHAIKIQSCSSPSGNPVKALVFCVRSAKEKCDWLEAFSQERLSVEKDLVDGMELAPAARRLARAAAARAAQIRPPLKPNGKSYKSSTLPPPPPPPDPIVNPSIGRRVGTWFNFGATKKSRAANSLRSQHLQQST